MKKFISYIIVLFLILNNFYFVNSATNPINETNLYYFDKNQNGKIDSLEIQFDKSITGTLNTSKLFLYSNTGGLSVQKLDSISGNNIFGNSFITGNILSIDLVEQDNFLTNLVVNNTVGSHLRLKTNAGVGISDNDGNEIKLLYGTSFNSYQNVYFSTNYQTQNNNSNQIVGKNVFQNPTYLIDKDLEKDIYLCDQTKTDCRVNFDLKMYSGSDLIDISTSKYNCEWNFGTGIISTDINNCNPNTIYYSTGIFEINYKIIDKNNNSNFFEKSFKIENNGYSESTSSGQVVETQTGTVATQIVGKNVFQNPTYLIDKDLEKDIYLCDQTKTDCRVNFDLKMYSGSDLIDISTSKYNCEWNFGSGIISTDINNCNPNTIYYSTGIFDINYKIIDKNNNSNFFEKSFKIENNGYSGSTSSGQVVETQTGTVATQIVGKNVFQNPTYLIDKDLEKDIYLCDQTKTDCKVNFSLQVDSGSGFLDVSSAIYNCEWNFGLSVKNGEENFCNPNTITYPEGISEVSFKITQKTNSGITFSKNFKIQNNGFKEPQTISYGGGGGGGGFSYVCPTNKIESINISTPKIEIQSGLNEQNKCEKQNCNVNFIYYTKNQKEGCIWDFSGGKFDNQTIKSCNPGYVYYPKGKFTAKLRVFEIGNEKNFKETWVNLENDIENNSSKSDDSQINPIIKIDGKISKTKEIFDDKIICYEDECSINFNGEESILKNKSKLKYFWDFGNSQTGETLNPKTQKYKKGDYKIVFTIKDEDGKYYQTNFFVEIKGKIQEEKKQKVFKKGILEISGVVPNPKGVDNNEYIEIKNISNDSFNVKGCQLDDEIGAGAKAFEIKDNVYLQPKQVKRFYKFQTNIGLNNTKEQQANILCNGEIYDNIYRNFVVPEGFEITKDILNIYSQEVFIKKVIDGDTFLVVLQNGDQRVFRHIGIDTPETKHPKKVVEKYGVEAYNFAKEKLEGKNVYLIVEKQNFVDKFGRMLGYFNYNSQDNNNTYGEEILKIGLAKVYDKFDFGLKNVYYQAENIAKAKKIGIWSEDIDFEKISLEDKSFNLEEKINDEKIINELNNNYDIIQDIIQTSTGTQNQKIENVSKIVQKTFSQKISKKKSGIKIYGKTFPNVKLILRVNKINQEISFFPTTYAILDTYETKTNKDGIYEININSGIEIGEYEIENFVKSELLPAFSLEIKNSLDIDQDYLDYIGFQKDEKSTKNDFIKSIIKIQGKIKKGVVIDKNQVHCQNMDECSINFDGRESLGKNLKYFWNFGNGNKIQKANPSSIKFTKGNYLVSLNVNDGNKNDTSYIKIIVDGKAKKEAKITIKENISNIKKELEKSLVLPKTNLEKHLFLQIGILLLFLGLSFIILKRKQIL